MTFGDLARRAAVQHGLVERRWLLDQGISPSMIQRWRLSGRLEQVQPRVYRVAGAPPTWEQRLLAVVLSAGAGAVASHRSSARLWRLHEGDEVEVTVPGRAGRRPRGAAVYGAADLMGAQIMARVGIPTTTPMRALVDMGAVVGAEELEDALDRGLARRLFSVDSVEHELDRLGRQGRAGVGTLRAVLDSRALGSARADGLLEPRMARLMRRHGLPVARFQYEVKDGRRLIARVDFAYPDLRLAIEVDGYEAHSTPSGIQGDNDRQNELTTLGWRILRFTWADVVRRPAKVAAVIRRNLDERAPALF